MTLKLGTPITSVEFYLRFFARPVKHRKCHNVTPMQESVVFTLFHFGIIVIILVEVTIVDDV